MIINTNKTGYSNIAHDRKRVSLTLHLNIHCLKIHSVYRTRPVFAYFLQVKNFVFQGLLCYF